MSTTDQKRPAGLARADAEALRDLFPRDTYKVWEFAGSLRRKRPLVGDVEHVIIPAWGEREVSTGLFSERKRVNLLMAAVDELEAAGTITRHVYSNGTHRWGEKYRGIAFRGFAHELFMADADNFGAILVIRTGPADFSHYMVKELPKRGFQQRDGYLFEGSRRLSVPDEQTYFRLAGLSFVPPERRA